MTIETTWDPWDADRTTRPVAYTRAEIVNAVLWLYDHAEKECGRRYGPGTQARIREGYVMALDHLAGTLDLLPENDDPRLDEKPWKEPAPTRDALIAWAHEAAPPPSPETPE